MVAPGDGPDRVIDTPADDAPLLVFGRAVIAAAARWPLAVVLWLPSFLVALVATVPVAGAAERLASTSGLAELAVSGGWVEVGLELALGLGAEPSLLSGDQSRSLLFSTAIGAAVAVAAVPFNGLLYTSVAGGVLERLAGSARPFVQACRHWFWPMLRFGLLAVGTFGLGTAVGAVAAMGIPGGNPFNDGLRVLLLSAWVALINGWLTTARADMVVRGDGRALAALGRSLAVVVQPAPALLWLGVGLLSGIHATLAASALFGISALDVLPAALAFQAAALAGSWLKLLQLGLAVELARTRAPQRGTRLAEGAMARGLAAGGL